MATDRGEELVFTFCPTERERENLNVVFPPSDLLYLWLGMRFTLVRLPRLLKVGAYTELLYRLDAALSRPYIIRIFRVLYTNS